MYYLFEVFTFDNLLDAYIALWSLFYDDFVNCHYDTAVQVFIDHCTVTEDACDLVHILENLKDNVFNFITVLMTIADLSEQTYLDTV